MFVNKVENWKLNHHRFWSQDFFQQQDLYDFHLGFYDQPGVLKTINQIEMEGFRIRQKILHWMYASIK